MSASQSKIDELVGSLKQTRDELKLQMHLANAELKDEWSKLDDKYQQLKARYEPARAAAAESGEDVWDSIKLVGEELRDGFNKIRQAL